VGFNHLQASLPDQRSEELTAVMEVKERDCPLSDCGFGKKKSNKEQNN